MDCKADSGFWIVGRRHTVAWSHTQRIPLQMCTHSLILDVGLCVVRAADGGGLRLRYGRHKCIVCVRNERRADIIMLRNAWPEELESALRIEMLPQNGGSHLVQMSAW